MKHAYKYADDAKHGRNKCPESMIKLQSNSNRLKQEPKTSKIMELMSVSGKKRKPGLFQESVMDTRFV